MQQTSRGSVRGTVKDQSGASLVKLGMLLRKAGYITSQQFDKAVEVMNQSRKSNKPLLSTVLIALEYVDEDTIAKYLNRKHNYRILKLDSLRKEVCAELPVNLAVQTMSIIVSKHGNVAEIAMVEPTHQEHAQEIQETLGCELEIGVVTVSEMAEALIANYDLSEEVQNALRGTQDEVEVDEGPQMADIVDFGELATSAADDLEIEALDDSQDAAEEYNQNDAPIIKLVNSILIKAVQEGVSDIHIEPFETMMQVRYRKDGTLFRAMNLPVGIKNALISRLKILASLNITERRVPQDGRVRMKVNKTTDVDFRVSTLPTLFGEGVVLRILDKSSLNVDLTKLGFEPSVFKTMSTCLQQPQGLLLVTGPTGSGKTVTLYSALNSLNDEGVKILTAEDPVEFNFRGINQVNVNNEAGTSFAAALKAFLRQDPDIIMVGEIRDIDTASIAIKAAMTGHLVFSTLHTNDCIATIGRLADIGIPPYMLASSITMVLAQRLAKKLCPKCSTPIQIDHQTLLHQGFTDVQLNSPEFRLHQAVGCEFCGGNGTKGRIGIFELLEVTEEVGKAISASLPEDQLRKIAQQEGMKTLRDDAIIKSMSNKISYGEILKRTVMHKESLPAYLVNPDIEIYQDKATIIHEGNNDKDFFKLLKGSIDVFKSDKKIAAITEPGSYFGEMSAISGEARSATLKANGFAEIRRYPGDKIDEIIDKYPDITKRLFTVLVDRLNKTGEITVKLATKLKG